MQHNSLDDLTVIIPSFNRPSTLNIVSNYWTTNRVKHIIVDGSTHTSSKLEFSHSPFCRYFHLPNESFLQRLGFATSLVSTKYQVFCPDDEIHTIEGLSEILSFYTYHDDYAAVGGSCFMFHDGLLKKPFFYEWQPPYSPFSSHQNLSNNPTDRLNYLFDNYVCCTFYSVVPTVIAQTIFLNPPVSSCFEQPEVFYQASLALSGKTCILKTCSWIRNCILDPVDSRNSKLTFEQWWLGSSYSFEVDNLIRALYTTGIKHSPQVPITSELIKDKLNDFVSMARRYHSAPPQPISSEFRKTMLRKLKEILMPARPLFIRAKDESYYLMALNKSLKAAYYPQLSFDTTLSGTLASLSSQAR